MSTPTGWGLDKANLGQEGGQPPAPATQPTRHLGELRAQCLRQKGAVLHRVPFTNTETAGTGLSEGTVHCALQSRAAGPPGAVAMEGVQRRGQGSQWSPDSPLAKSGELRAPCCQPGQALRVESVGGLHIGTGATKQRRGGAGQAVRRLRRLHGGGPSCRGRDGGGSGLDESSRLTCSLHRSSSRFPQL